MDSRIRDMEVRLLAGMASTLKGDYVVEGAEDQWDGSPFQWIKLLPSRRKGTVCEQLVKGWCAAKDLDVTRSGDSEADCVISGKRVEIKSSTLWETGIFKFQQFRDQNYEHAICLGISPFDVQCWVVSKDILRQHVIGKRPQHLGRAGTDTFWLSFSANEPDSWLAKCGGRLAQAYEIMKTW